MTVTTTGPASATEGLPLFRDLADPVGREPEGTVL